jgi:vacuolar-type H+-ATPase subunit E/Vma4
MARREAERPAERGARRAETNAVAAYQTALKGPRPSGSSKAKREGLMRRRAQVEQWISEERSPIREVELIQQRLDVDAQLDQAARLPELEEAFVNVAASWSKRSGISAAALREVGVPASVLRRAGLL